ncbi:MAG: CDP-diacylglycerol--serine O-phosphatidyltransferase [Sphingobacteriales bacterium]|nr:MAG: CDP-diacylglycerol--serine O-phosphatidyltransferase [Sphingobacteriales bacterium]
MIKKHLPNILTCANLLTGCVGVVHAFKGNLKLMVFFVLACSIFDFFDGFTARILNVKSDIGKELDSLADVISFGFLPSVLFYQLLLQNHESPDWLPYFGFFIIVFSALRLAKFNIDSRQSENFIGLNTPTNAFFVVSLPYLIADFEFVSKPYFLLVLILVLSYLLVSNIKLFSLKLCSTSWQANKYKYIFLICSAVSLSFLMFAAVPIILILYFVFSQLHFKYQT